MAYEDVFFPAQDGVALEGWFIPGKSDRLIIMNHPMPANRYGYPGHLEPWKNFGAPHRGEVLVQVHTVSLNFRDIAMHRDRYPLTHRKGLIPRSDGAGEVVKVGVGVDDFKVGDRVMGIFNPRWYGGRMPQNFSQLATAVNRSLAGRAESPQQGIARPRPR